MNISIFGLGYVGCVSLGCLAQNGHNLIGVDVVQNKIDLINSGKPTIIEKNIDNIIAVQHEKGRIRATKDYKNAVINSDVSIICVGTPSSPEGHLDLKYVYKVAEEIGKSLKDKKAFHVVAIRSTVIPGTNHEVGKIIEKVSGKRRNLNFSVVSNPEFLREGSAVNDYYNPAITVLGGDNEKALDMIADIYKEINAPIEIVDIRVAEIIKYVNNSFHALKITFANEVGNICKKIGIDSHNVMHLFCKDDQLNISTYYFQPGFAYGGSCLPKDLKGLGTIAHDNYLKVPVLSAIEDSNKHQIQIAYNIVVEKEKKNIGVLGLSFKPGTDDLRCSPSVELVERLLGKGFKIRIYDSNVNYTRISGTNKDYIDQHIPHLSELITDNFEKVIKDSELILITQKDPRLCEIIEEYTEKIFIDLVRISDGISQMNYDGICW